MAKKESPKAAPQISNIPLPISDVPLVIDLPDGQKLVIGKMTEGAVIEVATWRGTGRPDSRTNRLMLGMSSSQSNVAEGSSHNGSEVEEIHAEKKIGGIKLPKISLPVKLPKFAQLRVPKVKDLTFAAKGAASKVIEKSRDLSPTETVGDLDIEEWLAKITEDAARKVARSKASSSESNKKSPAATPPRSKPQLKAKAATKTAPKKLNKSSKQGKIK